MARTHPSLLLSWLGLGVSVGLHGCAAGQAVSSGISEADSNPADAAPADNDQNQFVHFPTNGDIQDLTNITPPDEAPDDQQNMGGPFEITSVGLPAQVFAGAPREALSVTWSGHPLFPVTVVYRATEHGCPGVFCSTPTMEFSESINPLEFPEAVWCDGSGEEVRLFDFEVVLIDARGVESEPAPAPVECLSGE